MTLPPDPDGRTAAAPAAVRRRVRAGFVECPRRGRVDVVVCFGCPLSLGLTTGPSEQLLCRDLGDRRPEETSWPG
jgi:hypothetical protein